MMQVVLSLMQVVLQVPSIADADLRGAVRMANSSRRAAQGGPPCREASTRCKF